MGTQKWVTTYWNIREQDSKNKKNMFFLIIIII